MQRPQKTSRQQNKKTPAKRFRYPVKWRDWPIASATILGLACWYFTIRSAISSPAILLTFPVSFFMNPVFSFLLLAILSSLYVYVALKNKSAPFAAEVMIRILSVVFIAAVAYVLLGMGNRCAGLFGVQTSCSETHLFIVFVLFFNPISLTVIDVLAVIGCAALLPKIIKNKTKTTS